MKSAIVVIFAKYPTPGKVKTRLAEDIGKKKAADLYKAMLLDVANISQSKDYDVALCFDPKNKEADFKKLLKIKNLHPQKKGDLGERMYDCFEHFLKEYKNVIIVGSDVPTINSKMINRAISKLKSKDVVLGKADDGGYYLIGMKEQHDVFDNIEWSTKTVLKETIDNINQKKLSYALLPSIIEIDTKKDLMLLKRKVKEEECKKTFEMLNKIKKL